MLKRPDANSEEMFLSQLFIISQVPGNRAEVAQYHDARKAVSASLSVLK